MINPVTITTEAQEFLTKILTEHTIKDVAVRIFIENAGQVRAETCLAFSAPGEELDDDLFEQYKTFKVYIDKKSVPYLEDAIVDYATHNTNAQLTIKAPQARTPQVGEDATLVDRVNYILYNDINPGVAQHGGECNLVEITEDNIVVLSFGGGCQGCAGVDATLKHGVESQLMAAIPELKGVRDVTDHSIKENAYY
jgi:Fe/S biogenesis protein NfuA